MANAPDQSPPPRLLTARQAAAYFNLPRPKFEALAVGRVSFGATVLYDRAALDSYLDKLSGITRDAAHWSDDADAALARFNAHLANPSGRP
jgi:hypothetical protein